jgi:hypothetical protein
VRRGRALSGLGPISCPNAPKYVGRLSGNSLSGADRALFGSAKRSRWVYFASLHRLVVPRIGAYWEFPDSLWKVNSANFGFTAF